MWPPLLISEGTGVAQPNAFVEAEVEKLKTGDRSDKVSVWLLSLSAVFGCCDVGLPQPEDSIPDLPENQAAREFLKVPHINGGAVECLCLHCNCLKSQVCNAGD